MEEYGVAQFMLKATFGLDEVVGYTPPFSTASVSVAAENFRTGSHAYEFLPVEPLYLILDDQGNKPYFTHQLISDRVQATYFNYNGLAYLAGICFVMTLPGEPKRMKECIISLNAFIHTWISRRRFPDENITHNEKMYGRDCERLQKRIVVCYNKSNDKIIHVLFNNSIKEYEYEFCAKCNAMKKTPSTFIAETCNVDLFYPTMPAVISPNADIHEDLLNSMKQRVEELELAHAYAPPHIDAALSAEIWPDKNYTGMSLVSEASQIASTSRGPLAHPTVEKPSATSSSLLDASSETLKQVTEHQHRYDNGAPLGSLTDDDFSNFFKSFPTMVADPTTEGIILTREQNIDQPSTSNQTDPRLIIELTVNTKITLKDMNSLHITGASHSNTFRAPQQSASEEAVDNELPEVEKDVDETAPEEEGEDRV